MSRLLLLYLFILCFFTNIQAQTEWQLLNPTPSYKNGKRVVFANNEIGFIITSNELLETKNAGFLWEKQRDLDHQVNDIAFWEEKGVIVGDDGYLLISNDYGMSWETLSFGEINKLVSISIVHEDTIFVSGISDLDPSPWWETEIDRLFRSFDGGMTWDTLPFPANVGGVGTSLTAINDIAFVDGQIGHAACAYGVIIKTTDGGNSWYDTEINTNIGDFEHIFFIASNPDVGFAFLDYKDQLYKTTNGGENWEEVYEFYPFDYPNDFFFHNENHGYACGRGAKFYETLDGGHTWESSVFLDNLAGDNDLFSLSFSDDMTVHAVGDRARIIKSTDAGNSWLEYSPCYEHIRQIEFPSKEIGYARTWITHEFYKTTDAGLTWEYMGSADPNFKMGEFDFVNENVGYVLSGGDVNASSIHTKVYKTLDGGVNWFPTNDGNIIGSHSFIALEFVNENIGFAGTDHLQNVSYRTLDGGATWEPFTNLTFSKLQFIDEQTGFGLSPYPVKQFYTTKDGGDNWEVSFETTSEFISDFDFVNEAIGYLLTENDHVFKSVDGGQNWVQLDPTNISDNLLRIDFYSEDIGYISSGNGNVYKTLNAGETWEIIGEYTYGSEHIIYDIEIQGEDIYLTGRHGKILKAKIDQLSDTKEISSDQKLVNIYPNPTDQYLHIELEDPTSAIESVLLTDLMGNTLLSITNVDQPDYMKIDLSDLAKGLHFLQIHFDDQNRLSRKILLR